MLRAQTINRKLILFIVLFSSAITVLTTAVQLLFDYRHDIALIEEHFDEIRITHLTGLEASLWIMDVDQVQLMLEGAVRLQDIEHLSISDRGKTIAEVGQPRESDTMEKSFILQREYEGQLIELGVLRVVASLEGVYRRLLEKVIVILITNAVKTFSVACFFLWLFRRLVTRHLAHIADFTRSLSPHKQLAQLELHRERSHGTPADELDHVVNAINEMQENLSQSYQDLARSEDVYSRAQKAANIGTWDWDISNNSLAWSEQIAPMFGLKQDAFENKYQAFIERVHPDDRQIVEDAISAAIEKNAPYAIEHRVVWADGTLRWVSEQGEVLRSEHGEAVRMIGVVQDITARKKVEEKVRVLNLSLEGRVKERTMQLESANRELEAFSYSVSHDLRAPLRAINGFSEILLDEFQGLDPRLRGYLQKISTNGIQMGELIDELLAFSQLSRKDLASNQVNISLIFRQVASELMAEHKSRTIDLQIDTLPPCIGDKTLLKQVVYNLMENAFKYTSCRDKAVIEVSSRNDGMENVYFIKDNGAGFDMRYSEKLFGVFQRLHHTDEFEGSGIGLALVKRILKRHRGRIWVEAEVDKGATFYFTVGASA